MVKEIVDNNELNRLVELHLFNHTQQKVSPCDYSTDLNEAWKIVLQFGLWYGFRSKTNIKTMEVSMGNDLSEGEIVTFLFIVRDGIKQNTYGSEGSTLARAICLSALKAKGIEVEDDLVEVSRE